MWSYPAFTDGWFLGLNLVEGLQGSRHLQIVLDRLLHRCHIVNIRGNSYRMRRHVELSRAIHPTASRAVSAEHAGNRGPGS